MIPETTSSAPERARRYRPAITVCLVIMTAIMVGGALWALRGLFEPFVLAVFLLLMIDGLARALRRYIPGMPQSAASATALLVILILFGLSIWAIADNARAFVHEASGYVERLDRLLGQASDKFGVGIPSSFDELIQDVNPKRYAGAIAEGVRGVLESAVFVLIYLGFLLASRRGFGAKLGEIFPDTEARAEAQRIFSRIRGGVESYVWVQTLVGLTIAAASTVVMVAMGLPHALFWAFIIFLASYIPIVGGAIGVLIPPLFGLVEFNNPALALVMLALLEAVHFVVGHVLQPRLQGKRLNLDPVTVLLALTFWIALWGVTGAFLSTPLTVTAMAILAEFSATRWIAVLMSGDGRPYAIDVVDPPAVQAAMDQPPESPNSRG
jgi:AI-2 transport protein TqsA